MADTLLGAIYATFGADAILAGAMPGSPWLDEPREGTAFPFAVVTMVKESEAILSTEGEKQVESTWEMMLHGEELAVMEAHGLRVAALFEGVMGVEVSGDFEIENRDLLRVMQTSYEVKLDKVRSTEARRIYEIRIAFEALWEKTRAS